MRAGGEFDGAANVVEAVGGGNGVVLVCLQDVAVDAALEYAGCGEAFAVELDGCVGAQCLQVDPVGCRRAAE